MNINFSFRWSTGLKSYYQVKRYPKGIETRLLRKGLPKPVHNEWPILNWKPVSFRVFSCLNTNQVIWLIGMILPNLSTFLLFLWLRDLWILRTFSEYSKYSIHGAPNHQIENQDWTFDCCTGGFITAPANSATTVVLVCRTICSALYIPGGAGFLQQHVNTLKKSCKKLR